LIYFFSDLDNTLVYSHRFPLTGERVAAEYLNGRVQSYMTKKSFDFLSGRDGLRLIPTTTRTREQYSRLSETFMKFGCRYALVCNGGILLDNNKADPRWIAGTRMIAENEIPDLREAENLIRRDFPGHTIHTADGIMLYVRTEEPALTASRLSEALDGTKLNIYYDSRKVYCIPSSINKGAALRRFAAREGISWSVAAGDSIPDVPMLEAADLALLPGGLSERIVNPQKRICAGPQCFSDFICDELSGLLPPFAGAEAAFHRAGFRP